MGFASKDTLLPTMKLKMSMKIEHALTKTFVMDTITKEMQQ